MKLVLWGRGRDFNILMMAARWKKDVQIVGVIQSECNGNEEFLCGNQRFILYNKDILDTLEFDYIIIANSHYKDIIVNNLHKKYINQMIIPYACDCQNKEAAITKMQMFVDNPRDVVVRLSGLHWGYEILPMHFDLKDTSVLYEQDVFVELADYTRVRTTELIVKELKENNIDGAMAEVGVFRGRYAKIFSHYFPEKSLYLYDTFQGFDSKQLEDEIKEKHANVTWAQLFYNTSEELVKNYIKNEKNTFIRKGFFPNTIESKEKDDKFCLVSLDADLYEPILEGLRFFYPRLVTGGYILVHDYNGLDIIGNEYITLAGVKKAIKDYEKEIGKGLCKVPISDMNGSVIITK